MQVTMQAAVSADGFIARENGDTDWVADLELYEKTCREYGCIAMGRTTYDEYGGPAFEGVEHIVLSSQSQENTHQNVHFVKTVDEALAKAQELGFDKLLVIGGGKTNGSFMAAGVVNNVSLDLHPIVLDTGKQLFVGLETAPQISLEEVEQMDKFVCFTYKVGAA